ncbi:MAG: hypothetical protein IPM48_08505 [Saprospiraceae bacterium]|nr:hypothetical protein [Saprospiraceae bacterium]
MEKPDFVVNTENIYKSFEDSINSLRKVGKLPNGHLDLNEIAISAYVKCYDFMLYICNLDKAENAFFQIPILRGLCEDLISITYLLSLSENERNSILLCEQVREFKSTLNAQEKYFKKYNPAQIVVPESVIPELKKYIKHYHSKGIKIVERYLPSVQKMSSKVGLEDLYDYIYFSTSKTVHFDIVTLMSMGWGEIDNDEKTISPIFSYQHNYHQYFKFVFFYTSVIFIYQTIKFAEIVDKSEEIRSKLEKLIEGYKIIDWPTILSFEQLNIPTPEPNDNIFYRVVAKMFTEGKIESHSSDK